ncbi:hypothetical protein KM043_015999 [Ampulex compressa]|nr:hypothetical protein KM043_015999 [Ampulex compressa]
MADHKYADLPGIAYDQVDVYETTNLPESDQFPIYDEDETDTIEKLHITASEAFSKFKGKYITGKGIDFSDRISYKPRTGYKFGEWELSGKDENETPIQKYQRLQCEVKELFDEMHGMKENAKEEEEVKSTVEMISQVELIEKQLNSIELEESLGSKYFTAIYDPECAGLREMISEIESFKEVSTSPILDPKVKDLKMEENTEPGTLKYQLMYLPEKARMQEVTRIALLEQRLRNLENVIGVSHYKVIKFSQNPNCHGIVDAVQQLGAKVALLDPSQLDVIECRLATLLHTMDSIAQKRSAIAPDSEQEQKIADMYEIMKKMEPLMQILPQTVDRMLALNTIHQQAADFSKSLVRLETLQSHITKRLESNKSLLQDVQESFASNLDIIKNNIISLEERIKKLNK